MCGTAPITDDPAHAFELEIEESQWNYVYDAIEYIKAGQREKKMTNPTDVINKALMEFNNCLLYTSPSPRDVEESRMPSSA